MSIYNYPVLHALRGVVLLAALVTVGGCHAATVLSEVFYDASGADKGLVFVELFGEPGTVLDGLLLEGINGGDGSVYRSVALSGVIPANGLFLIADDRGDGTSLVASPDLVADVDFQNGPDSIVLRDGVTLLDAIGYGDFSTGVFAGEGHAVLDAPAGYSLARFDPRLDSNDNLADFRWLASPSPGVLDGVEVPLPSAVLLFMSGIAALVGAGRRRRG